MHAQARILLARIGEVMYLFFLISNTRIFCVGNVAYRRNSMRGFLLILSYSNYTNYYCDNTKNTIAHKKQKCLSILFHEAVPSLKTDYHDLYLTFFS